MLNAIRQYKGIIEKELGLLPTHSIPAELYEPVRYVLTNGGKRIRPILTLISAELFDEDIETAMPAALALELFHNSTLVHDDIMDKADLRRGAPTVHKKWDTDRALLVGDIMIIMAYTLLGKLPCFCSNQVLEVFNDAIRKVYEGQTLDVIFESRADVTLKAYKDMIALKTATLFAASLKMGGGVAKASESDLEKIEQFGFNLGMAFQIQDDILDFFGEEKVLGKQIGIDLRAGKKTLLILKAYAVADDTTQKKLQDLLFQDNPNTEQVLPSIKAIFVELKIDVWANDEKEQFIQKAIHILTKIRGVDTKKVLLEEIVKDLAHRKS